MAEGTPPRREEAGLLPGSARRPQPPLKEEQTAAGLHRGAPAREHRHPGHVAPTPHVGRSSAGRAGCPASGGGATEPLSRRPSGRAATGRRAARCWRMQAWVANQHEGGEDGETISSERDGLPPAGQVAVVFTVARGHRGPQRVLIQGRPPCARTAAGDRAVRPPRTPPSRRGHVHREVGTSQNRQPAEGELVGVVLWRPTGPHAGLGQAADLW